MYVSVDRLVKGQRSPMPSHVRRTSNQLHSRTNYGFTNSIHNILWSWNLLPLSTILQLYRDGQFHWLRETDVPREYHRPVASHR